MAELALAAPGARKAEGRDLRAYAGRGGYEAPGRGIREGAAPGAAAGKHTPAKKAAQETKGQQPSGVLGALKKWLKERKSAKDEQLLRKQQVAEMAAEAEAQKRFRALEMRREAEREEAKKTAAAKKADEAARPHTAPTKKQAPPPPPPKQPGVKQTAAQRQAAQKAALDAARAKQAKMQSKEIKLKEGDYEEVKPKAAAKPTAKPPPVPKKPALMEPPKPKAHLPQAPPALLRGKEGGLYTISKGGRKIYIGRKRRK